MAYNSNIPLATDQKNISQADVKENFTQISNFVTTDHVPFTGLAANLGKHNKITLIEQAADPDQVEIDQATIYAKHSAITNQTGLFWQKEGTGAAAGNVIEMTAGELAQPGYCILPCGLKMCWGTGTVAGGSLTSGDVAFPNVGTTLAFATAVFSIQITPNQDLIAAYKDAYIFSVHSNDLLKFIAIRAASTQAVNFTFLAIGV